MFELQIQPVDLASMPSMPAQMTEIKLDADLQERVKGYYLQSQRLGMEEVSQEFLKYLAIGFLVPFSREKFEPLPGDLYFDQKQRLLTALEELSQEFSGRIPSIVWDSLAYLGTRPDPTKDATILAEVDRLPHPYYVVDTVLHALGKVYGLKMHIDSTVYGYSGMIFEHNCDCSCSFRAPNAGGLAVFLMPEKHKEATAALLSHLLSESLLLMGLKMPFEMGLSPEAAQIMAAKS